MDTVTKKIPTLLAHLNESIETHDLATESQTSSNMSWKEIGVCVTKIENPNELSEAKMTETTISKDAPAVNQPNRGHRKIITPKKPVAKPGSRSSDYFSGVKAESPLVLTPTQVLSAASTPSSSSGIWDSPETPLHAASNESRTEILTPFTPLTPETTNKPSAAETPAPLVRKLFLGTDANGPTIFDQIESRVPGASPHNDPEETSSWEDEDDLESMPKPKLFRGLTDQMNDIRSKHVSLSQNGYKRIPETRFNSIAMKSSLTRTRSKRTSNHTTTDNAAEPLVMAEVVAQKVLRKPKESPANTLSDLEHILPSQLYERLQAESNRCVASEVQWPDKRCARPAHGLSKDLDKILGCIWQTEDRNYAFEQLKILIKGVTCGTHKNVAFKRIKKLEISISDPAKLSKDTLLEFLAWWIIITRLGSEESKADVASDDQHLDSNPGKTTSSNEPSPELGKATPVASIPVAPLDGFRLYSTKAHKNPSLPAALTELIYKPTNETPGYIYIFWEKGVFGALKIGRTANLDRRLKEWNNGCKRDHGYHPATKNKQLNMIPHVNRIERLIHMELRQYRRLRRCDECSEDHNEWFQAPENYVVSVLQKWQAWIKQAPYTLDTESGKWVMKEDMHQIVGQVCKPIVPEEVRKPLPRHPKKTAKKRVSGRDSL